MKVRNLFKSILAFSLGLFAVLGLVSCGNNDPKPNDTAITNPLESLELTKDFENKSFLTDGIEKVRVGSISDGDTAYFYCGKLSVNLRFYGINTPESTWQIEKWGKAASNFTKGKLKEAVDIVIEATTTPPEQEQTGGRYLGYVWYKPKDATRYYNLNLEIVLKGFSNHNVQPNEEYYKYFEAAQDIASANKDGIHGDKEDPLFDETLEKVTVKDICLNPSSYDQQYVQVPCTIVSSTRSDIIIKDVIDGQEYTFKVYLGYGSLNDDRLIRPGNRVQFVGRVTSHSNEWQLSGIEKDETKPETTKIITEGYEMTFGQGITDRLYNYNTIKVTSIKEEGNNLIITGTTNNDRHNEVIVHLTVAKKIAANVKPNSQIICKGYNLEGKGYNVRDTEIAATVINSTDFRVI